MAGGGSCIDANAHMGPGRCRCLAREPGRAYRVTRCGVADGRTGVLAAVPAGLARLAGPTPSPVAGSPTVATGTLAMKASLPLDVNGLCKAAGIATDCHSHGVSGAIRGLGRVIGSYDFELDL